MLPKNTVITCTEDDLTLQEVVEQFNQKNDVFVRSYDHKKRKDLECLVPSTRSSSVTDMTFGETDYDEVKLILTHDHRVYSVDQQKFIRSTLLLPGTQLKHVDGIDVKVVKVYKLTQPVPTDVYTLTVDKTQCFYANQILVHNGE